MQYVTSSLNDIVQLSRWWFCCSKRRLRRSMLAASEVGGGIGDLVHEVVVALERHPPPASVPLSSAVCNQCRWTTGKLVPKALQRRATLLSYVPEVSPLPEIEDIIGSECKYVMETLLKSLTYREREIIKLRYGFGDGTTYSLEETARIFKVTRERIRQIESKAIRRLQHESRANRLRPFLARKPATMYWGICEEDAIFFAAQTDAAAIDYLARHRPKTWRELRDGTTLIATRDESGEVHVRHLHPLPE